MSCLIVLNLMRLDLMQDLGKTIESWSKIGLRRMVLCGLGTAEI